MIEIAIMVTQEGADEAEQLLRAEAPGMLRAESRGADGKLMVELIVTLTSATIPLLVKLYEKRLAANRFVQYKYKGLEIRGVSESTLLKLVDRTAQSAEKQ
jgi:hypothetical protein